ncbi:ricin-type beta-trefoil lectin domain protein [Streptomyces sp. NPDC002262]|uniref:ricin-type beta-trefoil lectin domain protein n=1 Tax=Streptomyces sp. NPDC002262 TaxID=3154414 RepID=UPI00331A6447
MRLFNLSSLRRPIATFATAACLAGLAVATTPITAATAATTATGTGPVTGLAGKCLTNSGGSTANGNAITLSTCTGGASQSWTLATDGSLQVQGKCLDVTNGATAPGAAVQLYSCNGSSAQRWSVAPDGTLVSAKSGNCLTVNGGSSADGTGTSIATCNPANAGQQWRPPLTDAPAPTNPGSQTSTTGVATGLLPKATGGLAPLSWSVTGLPAGMRLNYSTGTVVGTPTAAGTSTVTLSATDSRGNTGSTTFTWTVKAAVVSQSWYLDCSAATNGSGTQSSPWNSLAAANARTFQPGESLLLKSGATCNGQLAPRGNGSATAPITIGSYGGTARPIVAGGGISGTSGAAVLLRNQSYWIVQGLEVTNNAPSEAHRSGIVALVDDLAQHDGITIRNNLVHDVMGRSDRATDHTGFYLSHGIGVDLAHDGGFVKGLTIADNYIRDSRVNGIGLYGNEAIGGNDNSVHNQFVHVTRNTIQRNSNDGIVVCVSDSPLVEYNVSDRAGTNAINPGNIAGIWAWASDNPTFQFNEVSNIVAVTYDSQAWDCDGYITGTCTYQYNYDHSNYGGIFLNCVGCGGGTTPSIVFRNNVSVNDCRIINAGSPYTFLFANNTIDCRGKQATIELPHQTIVANNIFSGAAPGSTLPSGPTYQRNTYTGFTVPSGDPAPSTADPRFTAPDTAHYGIHSVGGYQLASGSPASQSGLALSGASNVDYWGNATSRSAPNRGAYGGPALSAPICTDDSSSAVTYTGSWNSSGSSTCGSGLDHWTSSSGAQATFTFTGTELTLLASQTPDNGIATISVDGQPAVDVNLYAPVKKLGTPVYTSPVLSAGTHTVRVTASGRADPRSTNSFISVDAFQVR